MMLIMLLPCTTLVSTLLTCRLPEVVQSDTCIGIEMLHMAALCGTIGGLWYHATLRNAVCTSVGGAACPSRLPVGVHDAVSTNEMTPETRPRWALGGGGLL